jgi:hypothetical protein
MRRINLIVRAENEKKERECWNKGNTFKQSAFSFSLLDVFCTLSTDSPIFRIHGQEPHGIHGFVFGALDLKGITLDDGRCDTTITIRSIGRRRRRPSIGQHIWFKDGRIARLIKNYFLGLINSKPLLDSSPGGVLLKETFQLGRRVLVASQQ